ncbi:ATPase [Vallitalea pronyensis]|uniref:ATPase n=1 Tax=Vallitalea pronyensis TaxID=1348613 RepID=A0A8J8MII8_9FIRM|nr:PRK06851 family protein [Vallitalea pronyensis]QUI21918.1 ATPase [Vallitalea pronyensis]
MEKSCKVRHYFPGGNTTRGFFSYYDYILPQEEATRIICLKGGPGVGKSTYMKRLGTAMEEKGFEVEYMHCSSDPHSLDGVVFPQIKVALIDGTAPHVVDPKNPGAVDEIIHLGDYWNEEGIRKNRKQILLVNKVVGKLFARAYRYLKAAKPVYDDMATIHDEALDHSGVYIEAEKVINKHLKKHKASNKPGYVRKLFASAITPKGLVNYLETVIGGNETIYRVIGEPGTQTSKLLELVKESAISKGFDVEAFYCPIDPANKLEHLVIKKLGVAFITTNDFHNIDVVDAECIDMNKYLNYAIIDQYFDVLQYDFKVYSELLDSAIRTIHDAKKSHDYMETLYIPHMDFDKVKEAGVVMLERIMAYAEEFDFDDMIL